MEIIKLYLIIFIGERIIGAMTFNPMLTYTLRFNKMTLQPNLTSNGLTINQYRDIQYVNAKFKIDSDKSINKIVAIFERCDQDRINCEYFQSWEFTDLCKKLKEKNQIWSRWYESYHPPLTCPIKKGDYEVINGTFNIDTALLWYPQVVDYQWRVTQKFYAGATFVGSYILEISIFGYRKRRSNKNNNFTIFHL